MIISFNLVDVHLCIMILYILTLIAQVFVMGNIIMLFLFVNEKSNSRLTPESLSQSFCSRNNCSGKNSIADIYLI